MRLVVSDIPKEGTECEFDVPVRTGDQSHPDTAHVSARIFRTGRKVIVEGRLSTEASLRCSRCLKEFVHPLSIDFLDEYNPEDDWDDSDEHELTGDEMELDVYRDDEIDLAEAAREQVLLAIPMKPLCSSDCKGICPLCGQNRNVAPCACHTAEAAPRLIPLQKLKTLMKDRKE